VGHVESRFGPFGDSVRVGAIYVHGFPQMYYLSELVLDTPDDTPGYEAQVEACLSPFGDSANLNAR
jgi:hypothetical protein